MCSLVLQFIVALVCGIHYCIAQASDPYTITVSFVQSNSLLLRCLGLNTNFAVADAAFFRNGVRIGNGTNDRDDCLLAAESSLLIVNDTPECDAHYFCGTRHPEGDGFILSEARTILAHPQALTSADVRVLNVCLGDSVNLPSNLHVSALDAQKVTWFRHTPSHTVLLGNPVTDPDYGLMLSNVGHDDSAEYFAAATNAEGSVNGSVVVLEVFEKPSVDSMQFDNGLITVTVTPEGGEFEFEWSINGDIMPGEISQTFLLPANVSTGDWIEVMISSRCKASVRTGIFLLSDSFPTTENGDALFNILIGLGAGILLIILLLLFALLICWRCKRASLKTKTEADEEADVPIHYQHPDVPMQPMQTYKQGSSPLQYHPILHSGIHSNSSNRNADEIYNPSAVRPTGPIRSIDTISEDIPDTTTQGSRFTLDSAAPAIPSSARPSSATDSHDAHHKLGATPQQTSYPEGQPVLRTPTPITGELAVTIDLYMKHKHCKNKGICDMCRAIEAQFTRLHRHCDPRVIKATDSFPDVKRRLTYYHDKATGLKKSSTKMGSRWQHNPHHVTSSCESLSRGDALQLTLYSRGSTPTCYSDGRSSGRSSSCAWGHQAPYPTSGLYDHINQQASKKGQPDSFRKETGSSMLDYDHLNTSPKLVNASVPTSKSQHSHSQV